ncbi:hypothetical protein M9Y10_044935 [Tritrichomonas musculus]|uniref:Uncharacterized protein n=1 Tax=Tritrichomonas musculus TaxID=1915356 RepID=A0ABR2JU08_9EUKA
MPQSIDKNEIGEEFQKILIDVRKSKKEAKRDELSDSISKKLIETLKEIYQQNRIIVRCFVSDSCDQAVAYSVQSEIGETMVFRAIDNYYSYTALICII